MSYGALLVNVAKGALAIGARLWANPTSRELICTGANMALNKLSKPSENSTPTDKPFSRENLAMMASDVFSTAKKDKQLTAEQINNLAIIANSMSNDGVRNIIVDLKNQDVLANVGKSVMSVLSPELERQLLEQPKASMSMVNSSRLKM